MILDGAAHDKSTLIKQTEIQRTSIKQKDICLLFVVMQLMSHPIAHLSFCTSVCTSQSNYSMQEEKEKRKHEQQK